MKLDRTYVNTQVTWNQNVALANNISKEEDATAAQAVTEQASDKETFLAQQKQQLQDRLDFQEQLDSSKAQAKAAATEYENLSKCFTIARRLMNGHHVPAKDVKFLAEKQPNMYKQAILCRQENAHPKKYKRLSKDEEETQESSLTDDMRAKLQKLDNQIDESTSAGDTVTEAVEAAEPTYASIDITI